MGRKIYSPEQIVRKMREVEVLISQGNSVVRGLLCSDLRCSLHLLTRRLPTKKFRSGMMNLNFSVKISKKMGANDPGCLHLSLANLLQFLYSIFLTQLDWLCPVLISSTQ